MAHIKFYFSENKFDNIYLMKKTKYLFYIVFGILISTPTIVFAQEKWGPTPSAQQLAWHEKEFYLFMHFGPNTFTDLEWGKGSEDPNIFNPTQIDCNQWARIAKAAGAKGIIITADRKSTRLNSSHT